MVSRTDNLVTILIKWFNIEDVYSFRHLMSSIAGWLAIFITALFAIWLADYRAGIFVLFLFAVSPTFIGHTQNNLKDIPFALAYIAGTFFMLKFLISGRKNSLSRYNISYCQNCFFNQYKGRRVVIDLLSVFFLFHLLSL